MARILFRVIAAQPAINDELSGKWILACPLRGGRGGFRWSGDFRHVDLLAAIRARRKFQ
jgi:hypothetical protein